MELTTRCTLCAAEFTDADIKGRSSCPSCNTTTVPCSIKDDVTVKINWHELHILCVWAENWANQIAKNNPDKDNSLTVMTIAQRLQEQFPDKRKLTLFSEMRELRESFEKNGLGGIETNIDDDSKLGL